MGTLQKIDYHMDITEVAERYGKSIRTIERWLADEKLGFPKPLVINKRRLFKASELQQFDAVAAGRDLSEPDKALGFPIVSGVIQTYDDFVQAMRQRRVDIALSTSEAEAKSGLQEGYIPKLENPGKKYGRGVGPDTLPLWLGGLRVGIVLVDLPRRPRKSKG